MMMKANFIPTTAVIMCNWGGCFKNKASIKQYFLHFLLSDSTSSLIKLHPVVSNHHEDRGRYQMGIGDGHDGMD